MTLKIVKKQLLQEILVNYNKNQDEIATLEKKLEIYDEELTIDIPDLGNALQSFKKRAMQLCVHSYISQWY